MKIMKRLKYGKLIGISLALLTLLSAAACTGGQSQMNQSQTGLQTSLVELEPENPTGENSENSEPAETESSKPEESSEKEFRFFSVNPQAPLTEESKTPEAQLQLFCDNYTEIRRDFAYHGYGDNPDGDIMFYHLAVVDFNRNGRLDFLVASYAGSGLCSSLEVYEVDESYTGIAKLGVDGEYDFVSSADFYPSEQFTCYEKDGKYYYFVEDVWSGGYDNKGIGHYAYSFGEEVEGILMGEFFLSPESPSDMNLVHVYLFDSKDNIVPTEEAFNTMLDSFWIGFKEQPPVEVKWMNFPEKEFCEEAVRESYSGYNENGTQAPERLDYTYFKEFYGDETQFVVEDKKRDQP